MSCSKHNANLKFLECKIANKNSRRALRVVTTHNKCPKKPRIYKNKNKK